MLKIEDFEVLLNRYCKGECNSNEVAEVESWYNYMSATSRFEVEDIPVLAIKTQTWNNIHSNARSSRKKVILPSWLNWAAAAVIAMPLCAAVFYYINKPAQIEEIPIATLSDPLPGGYKAILTLANGERFDLSDTKNRLQTIQNEVRITQLDSGMVVYKDMNPGNLNSADTNTIKTPKNGQYKLILPDGTKVYLNAGSSLKYPVRFAGNERRVTLTGEGYFEVTKNVKKPFIVNTINQTIKVLGTHFSVSSYDWDTARTTLAEGKVEVRASTGQKTLLTPNNQAIVIQQGIIIRKVNAASLTEWKDGLFIFKNTSLKDGLRQISGWYNVRVDYNSLPEKTLSGPMQRSLSFKEMLTNIETMSGAILEYEDGVIRAR
jgi:transmembrane sensor